MHNSFTDRNFMKSEVKMNSDLKNFDDYQQVQVKQTRLTIFYALYIAIESSFTEYDRQPLFKQNVKSFMHNLTAKVNLVAPLQNDKLVIQESIPLNIVKSLF